jgi:hypothetical protein
MSTHNKNSFNMTLTPTAETPRCTGHHLRPQYTAIPFPRHPPRLPASTSRPVTPRAVLAPHSLKPTNASGIACIKVVVIKKLVVEPWTWLAGPPHRVYWSGRAFPSGCTAFFFFQPHIQRAAIIPAILLVSLSLCDVFRVTTSLLP